MTLAPEPVLLDVSPAGVAVVLLNRPSKRNAFDELVIQGLREAFETLKGADHVRVVFLKGAGAAFSAGADREWMKRQGERSQADNEADALDLARMLHALYDLPQFTVALVDGPAMGGGAGLVAAADWAVATERAQFRFSEVRLGLTPATISPYVVEAIGHRNARALFASALPFDARMAERIGLVQHVVADEAALEGEMKRLAGLAMENAPGAVADAKALVHYLKDDATRLRGVVGLQVQALPHRVIDHDLMVETAKRIAARRASAEGREGLAAFLERRPARWDQ
jgi:methylglutaconyl-CoA hydratase